MLAAARATRARRAVRVVVIAALLAGLALLASLTGAGQQVTPAAQAAGGVRSNVRVLSNQQCRAVSAADAGSATVTSSTWALQYIGAQGFTQTPDRDASGKQLSLADSMTYQWSYSATGTAQQRVYSDSNYRTVQVRQKPGSTSTVQVLVTYISQRDRNMFAFAGMNWSDHPRMLLIAPRTGTRDTWSAGRVTLDQAAAFYAAHTAPAYTASFNGTGLTARVLDHPRAQDGNGYAAQSTYKNTSTGETEYVYRNTSGAGYFNTTPNGGTGYPHGYIEQMKEDQYSSSIVTDNGHIATWYAPGNSAGNLQAFYAEFDLDPLDGGESYLAFDQIRNGDWASMTGYPQPVVRLHSVKTGESTSPAAQTAVKVTVHGYYDSPWLDPSVYGVPQDGILPQGLDLGAVFQTADATSGAVQDVARVYEQHGDDCWEYTNGRIDFSGKDLGEVWGKFGQSAGRELYLPGSLSTAATSAAGGRLRLALNIFDDKAMTVPATFVRGKRTIADPDTGQPVTYADDDMRQGFMQATYRGKPVTVGVMYYLDRDKYGRASSSNGQVDVDFSLHVRPRVLREADPTLPLNPVGISPYRNLVHWLRLEKEDLQKGAVISQPIIPGFITAKCRVVDFQTDQPLERWKPGRYFEDAAQWMVGDGLDVAAHQTGDGAFSSFTVDCWGERANLNSADNRAELFRFPIGGYVAMDSESTDGGWLTNARGVEVTDRSGSKVPREFLVMSASDVNPGAVRTTGTSDQVSVYPIMGYSSCTTADIDDLGSHGFLPFGTSLVSAQGATRAVSLGYTSTGQSLPATQFYNPGGRCGELNYTERTDSYGNKTYLGPDWGMTFGPNLMVVAPTTFNHDDGTLATDADDTVTQPTEVDIQRVAKRVTIAMKGLGKEAISFGLVMGGDTSNADYNTFMPPAYQLSSLSFNFGLKDDRGTVDWTTPEKYNQNYFYYGSRLGKQAVPYHGVSQSELRVKDGASNDALPVDRLSVQLGNDSAARTQPKIQPVQDTNEDGTARAYTSDEAGKWLVDSSAERLYTTADGGRLTAASQRRQLTVTIPCGQAYSPYGTDLQDGTAVRAWADFNGNGAFDPEEASSVGTCDKQNGQTNPLRSAWELKQFTSQMPWTRTAQVTVTFDYPATHALTAKRNVWMRLRAVAGTHRDFLDSAAANERKAATAYPGSQPRTVNPDGVVNVASAYGSWRYTPSGETEDFLFDITSPAVAQDDQFCAPATSQDTAIDVLKNDDAALAELDAGSGTDPRTADPNSIVFMAGQKGVTVTDVGKTATVAGEGTYRVSDGKVTFTPDDALVSRATDGESIVLTPVTYGYTTATGATVYDRTTSATATITGTVGSTCGPRAVISVHPLVSESYEWDLDKQVLAGDDRGEGDAKYYGADAWVDTDSRERPSASTGRTVPLTYKLSVSARKGQSTTTALAGTMTVVNASEQQATVYGVQPPTVSGAGARDLTCALDNGDDRFGKTVKAGESWSVPFTCTSRTGTYPASGLTLTPQLIDPDNVFTVVSTSTLGDPVPGGEPAHESVRLTDVLSGDGVTAADGASGSRDLDGVPVTRWRDVGDSRPMEVPVADGLSLIVLSGSDLIDTGTEGTAVFILTPPDGAATYTSSGTQTITNTVSLCEAAGENGTEASDGVGSGSGCVRPPKIPADGDLPGATVPDAQAHVVIRDATVPIFILKTGVATDGTGSTVPLAGSRFELYADAGGDLGDKEWGEPMDWNSPDAPGGAQFIFSSARRGQRYWLVETQAPAGHQLLAQPVQIVVAEDGTVTLGEGKSDFVTVSNKAGDGTQVLVTVSDVEGAHLPAFGGPGVWLATILGGLLVLAVRTARQRKGGHAPRHAV